MTVMADFLKKNPIIAGKYEAAIARFKALVYEYEPCRWDSLDFSNAALSQVFLLDNPRENPILIEALCNLEPRVLERQYYYFDEGEFERVEEEEICQALSDNFFPNPISGEPDYRFKEKIMLRYVLSSKALADGL